MAESDLKSIKITIAGKVLPLSVEPSEEEMIRQVEKDLNEQINQFQIEYQLPDKMNGVVMILLERTIEAMRNKAKTNESNAKISDIVQEMDTIANAW